MISPTEFVAFGVERYGKRFLRLMDEDFRPAPPDPCQDCFLCRFILWVDRL